MRDETGTERRAFLRQRKILHRQQRRRAAARHEAGRHAERKAEGGRGVGGRGGRDLVQSVAREAAAQPGVERARQRERARPLGAWAALDARDGAAQMRNMFGPVGKRHPLVPCSLYVLS